MELRNKKIAILGFGVEGQATLDYLLNHGISEITVLDKSDEIDLPSNVSKIVGEKYLQSLVDFDLIFITPGIKPSLPEIVKAKASGVEFSSQIGLFCDLCPALVIGVTGTKGKGTTSTLIFEALKGAKKDVYLGGNIGLPAISFLDKLTPDSIVILELSSFQLQYIKKSPQIAVVLMVTSEHLDYHTNLNDYVEAKKNIIKFQNEDDFAVVNFNHETSKSFSETTKAKTYFVSNVEKTNGCFVEDEKIILKTDASPFRHSRAGGNPVGKNQMNRIGLDSRLRGNDTAESLMVNDDGEVVICKTDEVLLRGRHNLENITAGVMASYLAGVDIDIIRAAVKSFRGLEHRLEFVAEKKGVKYYNDSISTVPESAIAAINSFDEGIILIAGGSSKNSDYTALGKIIARRVKKVIVIGETGSEIEAETLKNNGKAKVIEGPNDMTKIVALAQNEAEPGDIVLLSPASASKDMFTSYKDRGDQFRDSVLSIK